MLNNFRLREFFGLTDYTRIEVVVLLIGFLCWVILYATVLRNIKKYRFVEIPFLSVCANIAWELYWGFFSNQGMGWIIVLGCKIWFFMDCLILYYSCKYNKEDLPTLRFSNTFKNFNNFYLSVICWIVFWFCLIYNFSKQGYDNHLGATSGMIMNIGLSFAYIFHFVNKTSTHTLSYYNAWYKFLGTGMISIVCFLKWSDNYFLLTCCLIVTLLDISYLIILRKRNKKNKNTKFEISNTQILSQEV